MTASGFGRAGKAAVFLAAFAHPATLITPTASAVTALSMRGADVSTAQRADTSPAALTT
jgi:arabinogalactan endo-1,4-beta-galactosidase